MPVFACYRLTESKFMGIMPQNAILSLKPSKYGGNMTPVLLGKTTEMFGLETLKTIAISDRPTSFPLLSAGEVVVCLFDRYLNVLVYACTTVADMQQLFDAMAAGGAKEISWRAGVVSYCEITDLSPRSAPN